jgi:mono/diheme cytochrome c family protein
MQFPYFQFPLLGDPLIIAIDAVLHVFISHGVAIGLMSMIFVAEFLGLRRKSEDWEDLAESAVKPAVIVITGIGAMTGVGIWFITSGLVPAGIGSMLRVFFWPWFIEWVVFFLEVVVVLIYYFTWRYWTGRMKKYHVALGAGYVVLAGASAFLITGILGFMLTSDGWPWNKNLVSAFFNPSFGPMLGWRFSVALTMGGLLMITYMLFFHRADEGFRREALRRYGIAVAVPMLAIFFLGYWWFSIVPPGLRTHAKPSILEWAFANKASLFWSVHVGAEALFVAMIVVGISKRTLAARILVIPTLLAVWFFVAEFERVREFLRGPYLMPGYMYANTVLISERELFDREGMLPHAHWFHEIAPEATDEQKGAFLFAMNCGTCHTIGGRNDIRDRFRGRSEDGAYVILGRTEQMVPWMPPFSGTDHERRLMSDFIVRLTEGKVKLPETTRYPPLAGGTP